MPFFTNRGIVPLPTGSTPGAEASAFLTRAAAAGGAPDTAHTNAYTDLINGLVADGVWSLLDILCIFATDTKAHAYLNLKSANYNALETASAISHTADRGINMDGTGTNTLSFNKSIGATVFIPSLETGATPPTQFQQDAACIGCWTVTSPTTNLSLACDTTILNLYPNYSGQGYARVNDLAASGPFGSGLVGTGLQLGVRLPSSQRSQYINGAAIGTVAAYGASTSTTPPAVPLVVSADSAYQVACVVYGGNVDAVQLQLYNNLRTYMTAVGVP